MVFKTKSISKSIFENIAYGPKIHGIGDSKAELNDLVLHSLERAGLIDEVKDRLDISQQDYLAVNSKEFVSLVQ